jgi:phosphatidate cytidylyltransferase
VLARRFSPAGRATVIDNLNARINAWWVMAALVGVAFAFGRPGVLLLFFLVSLLALREFVTLLPTRGGDYWALVAAFYLVLPIQYVLVGSRGTACSRSSFPVYAFLLLPISRRYARRHRALPRAQRRTCSGG